MIKNKSIISMLLVGILFLSACSDFSAEQADSMPINSYSEPLVIQNGTNEITLQQEPQKVLTLGPNCTELLVALGLSDKIIGTSLNNHSRGPLPEYEEIYNNLSEITHGSATREAVLSSGADFIYGINWEFGEAGLDINELASYGITVYQNNATTVDEMMDEIKDLGRIFNIEDTVSHFIENQKQQIEGIQQKLQGETPVKVFVYDSGNSGVFTASGANFETQLIELAGGTNIFSDIKDKDWVTVSYEDILRAQPDIILIHDYDVPSVEEKIEEIKTNPILSQLDCVKNERFASITLESVLPGDRMAYAVQQMASSFFPDSF